MQNILEFLKRDDTSRWLRLVSLFVTVFVETRWFIKKKYNMQFIIFTIIIAMILGHLVKF